MNIPALISGSVFIIIFSWYYSIRHKRYHGIPRFLSFECIYILLLLNIKYWFSDPLSWNQLISWILLILSAWSGLAGYFTLRGKGQAVGNFENTTALVKSGVFGLIRHPLYFSLLLLGTGIMMKNLSLPSIAAGMINLVALWFTARTEEKEMIDKFGQHYKDYIGETKMFIPFIL